ncbi:GAF domain-containing protein [Arthrobacter sp. U41]|uniref:GAF domain-containing protein n=1 Tax=Arthrobacter sp. U41 TaxID=1849032 RepID=UPI00164349EE|nr:GAF domain-containing protein [Arthrobacter sp. U41]
MVSDELVDDFEQLVDLIADTEDIKSVLGGLTVFAAEMMSKATKAPIECAVTLRMRKRTATIGGSSDRAVVLDRIEQALGDGPCVDALDSGVPVLLGDVQSDPRWPEYRSALAAADVRGALGVFQRAEPEASRRGAINRGTPCGPTRGSCSLRGVKAPATKGAFQHL